DEAPLEQHAVALLRAPEVLGEAREIELPLAQLGLGALAIRDVERHGVPLRAAVAERTRAPPDLEPTVRAVGRPQPALDVERASRPDGLVRRCAQPDEVVGQDEAIDGAGIRQRLARAQAEGALESGAHV